MDKEVSVKKQQLLELIDQYKQDPRCRQKKLRFGPEKPSMQYFDYESDELLDLKIQTFERLIEKGQHISEDDANYEILEHIFKAKGSQFLACQTPVTFDYPELLTLTLDPLPLEPFDYETFAQSLHQAFKDTNGPERLDVGAKEDTPESKKKRYSVSFSMTLSLPLPEGLDDAEKAQHLSGEWVSTAHNVTFEHMYRRVLARLIKPYAWLYDVKVKQCFKETDHASLEIVIYDGSSWDEKRPLN